MLENSPYPYAVIVALGSNLATAGLQPADMLRRALDGLDARGARVVARSRWWSSAAWPDADDPPFLNGVVLVDTLGEPEGVLAELLDIERTLGRDRRSANAPRTIDLDLVAFGRCVIDTPSLILPHPRAHERLFVMGPLAEIAPAWRHPVLDRTAVELAAAATVGRDARPV